MAKMPMTMKNGKKVPTYAADGIGKMNMGGIAKKKGMHKMPDGTMMKDSDMKSAYMHGGMAKTKPMKSKSGYNMGGSVKGYAKGGYANCGASVPGTQRGSK